MGEVQEHKRTTTNEMNLQVRTGNDARFQQFRRGAATGGEAAAIRVPKRLCFDLNALFLSNLSASIFTNPGSPFHLGGLQNSVYSPSKNRLMINNLRMLFPECCPHVFKRAINKRQRVNVKQAVELHKEIAFGKTKGKN